MHINASIMSQYALIWLLSNLYQKFKMASNEDLEKRIEILEKEVQHLKYALQYQIKKKKQFD